MNAGREIDALVAEKVMGWVLTRNCWLDTDIEIVSRMSLDIIGKNANGFDDVVPRYSTDIAAAWEVVEKFRCGTNGKAAACVQVCVTDIPDPCDTYCKIYAPDIAEVVAWANEPPLAICLAALKAVVVEVPE